MAGGRPIKKGLDYYQLDTSPGNKVKYLKRKCKKEGYGVFVEILERIYKFEGYYCKWDEMSQTLFCEDGLELNRLKEIVECCLEVGLFNREIFNKYSILTSNEIQRKYMFIIHSCKRKGIIISQEFNLIPSEQTHISSEETTDSSEESKKKSLISVTMRD